MTNEELKVLLRGKSEEWHAGFFAAVNLTPSTKAAFLKLFIGQTVEVMEVREPK